MTPKQVLSYYKGNTLDVALAIDYTEAAVRYWVKSDSIPYRPQKLIEAATGGKLKAKKPVRVAKRIASAN